MGRVCDGPSLYGPSLLWAEFVMGRVCYGLSCPVTVKTSSPWATLTNLRVNKYSKWTKEK